MRRFISAVAVLACAGGYGLAANERVTFVLTNGERQSGTVVHHGGQGNNLIDNNFNVGLDNGQERSIRDADVAVIDFAADQPALGELQQLPAAGQWLALRNGQGQGGTLVNLVNGETVIWRNAQRQDQQYAIRDVARVYLNLPAARVAYNATGIAPAGIGTSGVAPAAPLQSGEVRVQANQAWTDTGVNVKKGDRVAFQATGQIAFGRSPGQTAGPDGNGGMRQQDYPVPVMPVGGLIGKVGAMAPFPIGSNTQPIVMPADGRLMLGINDSELGDNSGFFSVIVTKR